MTTAVVRLPRIPGLRHALAALLAVVVALLITALTIRVSPATLLLTVVLAAVTTWMLASDRYALTLAVLMLYLGLLDGYVKLKVGASWATLLRDLLLYAIAVGALVRAAVRGQDMSLPLLTGWVVAFCLVTLIQVFNPANDSLSAALSSVRPHLEFVPLFFLGFYVMRSKRRLQGFLVILAVVGAANGVVNWIQFDMTPAELAGWGPGYESKILSDAEVSSRAFLVDENTGETRTRPFGLGADQGFGGAVAALAVSGVLALFLLFRTRLLLAVPLTVLASGLVVAVMTSQARVVVISAVLAVIAFAALASTAGRLMPTVAVIGVAMAIGFGTVSVFVSGDPDAVFRYDTITPGRIVDTTFTYRKDTLAEIPNYMVEFPLGAGLGTGGPAAGFLDLQPTRKLNSESEWTYLLIELGIPGLLVLTAFNLRLFGLCVSRLRKVGDPEMRLLLAAIAASLFVLFATWVAGIATASTPGAPYFWFAAGVLAYWLGGPSVRSGESAGAPTAVK